MIFFWIGNREFIDKKEKEHRVRDDEHTELEANTKNSRSRTKRKQKSMNGSTLCVTPNL